MNTKQAGRPRIGVRRWIVVILLGIIALPFTLATLGSISNDQITHSVVAGQLRTLFSMPDFTVVAIVGTLALAVLALAKTISWKVAGLMMLLMAVWPAWLWFSDDVLVREGTTGAIVPTVNVVTTQQGTGNQPLLLAAAIAVAGILMIIVGLNLDRRASGTS